MSARQVVATVRGLLADGALGLEPRAVALAATAGFAKLKRGVRFGDWQAAGAMRPGGKPFVTVAPVRWDPPVLIPQEPDRDSEVEIRVTFEVVDADLAVLQSNVEHYASALARAWVDLRAYSEAHGGTIVDTLDPLRFAFGTFADAAPQGSRLTAGFTMNATLIERSGE